MQKGDKKPWWGGSRVLGTQSREKGLLLQMEHPILGLVAVVSWGTNTPRASKSKSTDKKDQGESFHAQDAKASINLRTVHNGKVCKLCLLNKKKLRETEHLVLIGHTVWQPGSKIVLGKRYKSGKRTKRSPV